MKRLGPTLVALTVGCVSLPQNGALKCGPSQAHPCPSGFHCASNQTCWRDGQNPTDGSSDMAVAAASDMALGFDMPCPGLSCGGVCVDPTVDQKNCGGCGHDCSPGMCAAGKCQPYSVAPSSWSPHAVTGIFSDGTELYFTTGFEIGACRPSACMSKVNLIYTAKNPFKEAVIDPSRTHIFLNVDNGATDGSMGSILRCTLPLCSPIDHFFDAATSSNIFFEGLAVDDANVYWGEPSAVRSCSANTATPCPTPVLVANIGTAQDLGAVPGLMVSDGTTLFWVSGSQSTSVVACTLPTCTGGGPTTIAPVGISYQLHVFGNRLYWYNEDSSFSSCLPSSCMSTSQNVLPSPFAAGKPGYLGADATTLYLGSITVGSAQQSAFGRCTPPNCSDFSLVGNDTTMTGGGFLVSDKAIYWSVGSQVFGVSK